MLSIPTSLLLSVFSFLLPIPEQSAHPQLQFQLRHLHTVSDDGHILFADHSELDSLVYTSESAQQVNPTYAIQSRITQSHRPSSPAAYQQARERSLKFQQSEQIWEPVDVVGPDVESRDTLLNIAKMTNNAYLQADDPGWYTLDGNWTSSPFGWEPDTDGFRGHVFATPTNDTIIVSIKGTSASIFGGGGPTVAKDKINDNLLFSCCCARVDWTWTTVCDCYQGTGKCGQDCLEDALIEKSLYYSIATNLYNNLTYMYPDATIWITGHSLGGALASLIGVTFGAPVVSFEAPGERMAARRLHLPSPPSTQHITHVYHTADPISMGVCNGLLSSCSLGGYALETGCHLGKSIVYDTVSELSWSVDIRTHGIVNVIDKLLAEPWTPSVKKGREVPEAVADGDDCVDCYSWEFP